MAHTIGVARYFLSRGFSMVSKSVLEKRGQKIRTGEADSVLLAVKFNMSSYKNKRKEHSNENLEINLQ